MRIDRGSGYLQPGGTGRFEVTPDEGVRTAQVASNEPVDACRQANHQPGATAFRSSGYRPPLRGENHWRSLLNHLPLQNDAVNHSRRSNPYIDFPDSELLKAVSSQFPMLKKLNEK
ncbi:hypothetical protein RGV33_21060 [Pseudomonas sp. Bout1]|uniref:hypothetical protein n=1 Tax=Pseudomonas sp. Bout1 TaxID=3048600 RepID=UPI002AB37A00|nr:hypothetical protein [Pseudomonas sp. Bout1]MDY7534139.1 hypothetical protein [Pseudomonas sp. Bout1]MEB0186117.1 hypothetical protein [Pseudomonas sp. Bout1]